MPINEHNVNFIHKDIEPILEEIKLSKSSNRSVLVKGLYKSIDDGMKQISPEMAKIKKAHVDYLYEKKSK